jgi:hypothetical protein
MAIERATGVRLGRRQVEQLAACAAADVDAFYAANSPDPAPEIFRWHHVTTTCI